MINVRRTNWIPDWVRESRGFTLIELLTVIFIIGIITTVVSVNLTSARKQARDVRRQTDLSTLQSALELYANANGGVVPTSVTSVRSTSPQPWIPDPGGKLAAYISSQPIDPINKGVTFYSYATNAGGTAYFVDAVLEIGTQSDQTLTSTPPSDGSSNAAFVSGKYWDGANLHYRVSSGSGQ